MPRLAYRIRGDWAQQGTAVASQSARIREWLGDGPTVLAVQDVAKHNHLDRGADVEVAAYLFPDARHVGVVSVSELSRALQGSEPKSSAAVVLHPFKPNDLARVREIVTGGKLARVFVLVWAAEDMIRWWLEGAQATDLHTGRRVEPTDPLMVETARMMVDQTYNGLATIRGKDVVVGLVRLFASRNFATDERSWLRAYFAAGGDFAYAESVKKLVSEIHGGKRHRIQRTFGETLFELLQERVAANSS